MSVVIAQQRRAEISDIVTQAEHERLRAEVSVNDAVETAKLNGLEQRIIFNERQINRNTLILDALTATINRLEGIGISFGVVLGTLQWFLYRAHTEAMSKVRSTDTLVKE